LRACIGLPKVADFIISNGLFKDFSSLMPDDYEGRFKRFDKIDLKFPENETQRRVFVDEQVNNKDSMTKLLSAARLIDPTDTVVDYKISEIGQNGWSGRIHRVSDV
jgi:hypothetical protein